MEREDIDDIVCDIMINDGPDAHVDGHDKITDFIIALLNNNGEKWGYEYRSELEYRKNRNIDWAQFIKKL